MEEIARAGATLKQWPETRKVNIGALGNMVPQLHIHVVARKAGDAAWPGPVWGAGIAEPYGDLGAAAERFRRLLDLA